MAAYTSTKSGSWTDPTVWGGTVPGDGDTATIAAGHAVTIPDGSSVTIGISGATGTTAVTIGNTGKLAVGTATGATLRIRGDLIMAQTAASRTAGFYALDLGPGSTLEFDSSAAASPSTSFYQVGPSASNQPNSRVRIGGTDSARCTVIGNASGTCGRFGLRGFTGRLNSLRATCTDFVRVGDSTRVMWEGYLSSAATEPDELTLDRCTFASCGRLRHTAAFIASGTICRIVDCAWAGTLSAACAYLSTYSNAIGASGVREILRCAFDKGFGDGGDAAVLRDFTIRHCMFEDNIILSTSSTAFAPAAFDHNVVRKASATETPMVGNVSDCFWLCDFETTNPHFLVAFKDTPTTIDGLIFQYTGAGGDGDGILQSAEPAAVVRHTVRNCLVLPRSDGFMASCTLVSSLTANGQWGDVTHNTYMGSVGGSHALHVNETTQSQPGSIQSAKSNLFWDTAGGDGRANHFECLTAGGAGVLDNIADPATLTHNCAFRAKVTNRPGNSSHGTSYDLPTTGAVPGADDVDVDPQFVDATRNFERYATTKGQLASVANTLAILRGNLAVEIPALLDWVRGGFAPTNVALDGAGHDGATIGAVPYQEAGPPAAGVAYSRGRAVNAGAEGGKLSRSQLVNAGG